MKCSMSTRQSHNNYIIWMTMRDLPNKELVKLEDRLPCSEPYHTSIPSSET
jgi:hypothetical protein